MAKTIEVGIHQLKESYCSAYDKAYEKWVESWWHWDYDVDWVKEGLKEDHKWLDVDRIVCSVSYSQGDFAAFTGDVNLITFLEERDHDNEYFVLREAMKLGSCDRKIKLTECGRYSNVSFSDIDWTDYDTNDVEFLCAPSSPLDGMPFNDYYEICIDQIGDLETWVKEVCKQEFDKLYYTIRDDIEYQTSEDSFVEWAHCNDEKFEVEVDDDGYESVGDAEHFEDCRIAA